MVNPKLKLGIALFAGVAVVLLLFRSISNASVWTYSIEELTYRKAELTGQVINLEAEVLPQSIQQKPGTLEYRFQVIPKHLRKGQDPSPFRDKVPADVMITVYHTGEAPDTLWMKDEQTGYGAEVTATGTLQPDGTFVSHKVVAKCPSKYEASTPAVTPQAAN